MITWQSFGRISVPSTSSLSLIPSGKRVDTSQPVLPSYVCISLSLSSFSVFLFCYSLDSRFYLFTPFAFTAFSFLYSNSVSHTLFFFSLSLLPLLSLSLRVSLSHSTFITLSLNRAPHHQWTTLARTSCISLLTPDAPLALAL